MDGNAGGSGAGPSEGGAGGGGAGGGGGNGGVAPPHASGAVQPGGGSKPTLERTFNLMQAVQGNCILVSRRQEGNPVLRHVRNVRWQFADIVPDYILGNGTAALYISVRYHLLHPDYLYFRIRELQRSFRLRLVLCHVDVEDMVKALGEVNKTCVQHACTLVCAWSPEEVARYLETFKLYEHKTAEGIQERTENDYTSRLAGALTTIKGVNKVDVVTLGSTFGTLAALMTATTDQLAACPGLGPTKVRRIHDTFHAPFRRTARQLRIQDAVRDGSAGGGGAGAAAAGTEAQQQGGIGGAAVGAHDGGQLPPRQEAPAASFAPAPLQQQLQQQQQQALPPATGADVRAAEDDAAAAYGEDDDGYAAAAAAEFDEDFEVEADAHLYACADPEMSDEDPAGRL